MLYGQGRNFGWFRTILVGLVVFSGPAGVALDAMHDHISVARRVSDQTCPRALHIERGSSPERVPCTACFLHRLLSQSLMPSQGFSADIYASPQTIAAMPCGFAAAESRVPVNRGPPGECGIPA